MVGATLRIIHRRLHRTFFLDYSDELKEAVKECKTLLDIGCGAESPIKSFSKNIYSVGIDAFKPSIEKSRKKKIHDKYYCCNVLDIDKKFKPNSFDCVLASDLIEHLDKEDGLRLIEMMRKIAKKKVVIFTPNGFVPQEKYDGNKWQVHKSGWTVEEMKKLGYKIIGINGLKMLRHKHADIKFWPKIFWGIISEISQFFVRNNPKHAFQILCIKRLRK